MKFLVWMLVLTFPLGSCQFFQSEGNEQENAELGEPIARVKDKYLYKSEVEGLVPQPTLSKDSINIINRYVESWVRKQLMLTAAEENMDIDESEIQRRLLDYRYQLLVYTYEKQIVEENLDTVVTQEEVRAYYEANQDNFELKENIIKGFMVKVPNDAPRVEEIRNWFVRTTPENEERLRSYAYSYADFFHLNDSMWVDFDELILGTPMMEELVNPVQTLKTRRFLESSDSAFVYYLKIKDYKISDQTSPVEFVSDRIKDIIINKRKVDLRKEHEDKVFQEAIDNEDYEIY